jgi:hypothetical protein
MSYINLEAHFVSQTRGGIAVGAIGSRLTLGSGVVVSLPTPFLRLSDSLAIAPVMVADGEAGVRIDLARWVPMRYGAGREPASFPMYLPSQALAAQVAFAFDADPATTWEFGPVQAKTWLEQWAAAKNVTLTA